ncbi:hypothetical protein ACP70R_008523 [Stipagrostis hirtigluma subsp. patula]
MLPPLAFSVAPSEPASPATAEKDEWRSEVSGSCA